MKKRFPPRVLAEFKATKYMRIRAGEHRFIAIWVVVIGERVIVRSWNDKPGGWYRAFLAHPEGEVQMGNVKVPIRGIALRNMRLNDAADAAYARKYATPANEKYVIGLRTSTRKATTLELVPA